MVIQCQPGGTGISLRSIVFPSTAVSATVVLLRVLRHADAKLVGRTRVVEVCLLREVLDGIYGR